MGRKDGIMKKYILIAVEDDREYDIYEELDVLEGIQSATIGPHQMNALMYTLNDMSYVYTDIIAESDFDTEEEYEMVTGYGNALKRLYNTIIGL